MLPLILTTALLSPPAITQVVPRQPLLKVHVAHFRVFWKTTNVTEVKITGITNTYSSADLPPWGSVVLPIGKYKIEAFGDKDRTAVATFEIK